MEKKSQDWYEGYDAGLEDALASLWRWASTDLDWYEGYDAGLEDADPGPSGALTWASIVGASIIIGFVILWLLNNVAK